MDSEATSVDNVESGDDCDPQAHPRSHSKFNWTPATIALLLEEYRKRKYLFRMKGTKKKDLWKDMQFTFHQAGYKVRAFELDRKFRNMKRTYVHIKLNSTSSYVKSNWEYYHEFEDIFEGIKFNRPTLVLQTIDTATPSPKDPLSINRKESNSFQHDKKIIEQQQVFRNSSKYREYRQTARKQTESLDSIKEIKPPKNKRFSKFKSKLLELERLKIEEIKQLRISIEKIGRERNKLLSSLVESIQYNINAAENSLINEAFSD